MDAREVIERELRRMIADGESHLMGARYVLSALDAAGWCIVPKEPTDAMLEALMNECPTDREIETDNKEAFANQYRAMLSACRVNETEKDK